MMTKKEIEDQKERLKLEIMRVQLDEYRVKVRGIMDLNEETRSRVAINNARTRLVMAKAMRLEDYNEESARLRRLERMKQQ